MACQASLAPKGAPQFQCDAANHAERCRRLARKWLKIIAGCCHATNSGNVVPAWVSVDRGKRTRSEFAEVLRSWAPVGDSQTAVGLTESVPRLFSSCKR